MAYLPIILFSIMGALGVLLIVLIILYIVTVSKNKKNNQTQVYGNQVHMQNTPPNPASMQRQQMQPLNNIEDTVSCLMNEDEQFELKETGVLMRTQASNDLTINITKADDPSISYSASLADGGKIALGRNSKLSNIALKNDISISGKHCEISRIGDGVYIEDSDSTNGTFLEGNRITSKMLLSNTNNVTLGNSEYRIDLN